MEKNWIKIGLSLCEIRNLDKDEKEKLILVIMPIIEKLKKKRILKTFHFFFEPFLDLRIQVKKEEQILEAKEIILKIIDWKLQNEKVFVVFKNGNFLPTNLPNFLEYFGEEEDFGKDGWAITKKFFEIGSRFALCKMDEKKDRKLSKRIGESNEGRFEEGKFVHLILNQLGYSTLDEANFHLNRCLERLIRISSKEKAIESLKESLEKIRKN